MPKYFDENTDKGIERFLRETDIYKKNEIFENELRKPFEDLIDGLVQTYKFFKGDDVDSIKKEALTFLYLNVLPKFKPEKATKGFSYFNYCARNWFFGKTTDRKKKNLLEKEFYPDHDGENDLSNDYLIVSHFEEQFKEKEFWQSFLQEISSWREINLNTVDKKVLEAIIQLFNNKEEIPLFKKKAIMIFIEDMTGLEQKKIFGSLKRFQELYEKWKRNYLNNNA